MTEEQYKRAAKLIEQRDYYKGIAERIGYEQWNKARLDDAARERIKELGQSITHTEKWQLSKWFEVKLKKNKEEKAKVVVMPHYELAHGIEMDAEPELVEIIRQWLEEKAKQLDQKIEEI